MKMSELSREQLAEELAEELTSYLAEMRLLMKKTEYSVPDYEPTFLQVVDFALSQNIILLSKNVNAVLQSGGKLYLPKSYLSGLRTLSDLFSTLKKTQDNKSIEPLDETDPLLKLRKSLKIVIPEEKK